MKSAPIFLLILSFTIVGSQTDSDNDTDNGYIKIKVSDAKSILAWFLGLMGIIVLVVLVKFVRRFDKRKEGKLISTWSGLYRFSKEEIEKAINYGHTKVRLGSGSAGQVYQGILPSRQLVAIKHIYRTAMSGSFMREVEGLSKIRHSNLVSLFGFCDEGGEQYLVYEYCSNGNLAQNLLRSDSVLSWDQRVKILRDCALVLRFLHFHPDGCIVHRDIKLTNILLTENMESKLSDFGLAKVLNMEESKVFTDVRGTIGYMDPEYMTNARLTGASDIYSFGIVALQILSGRKVIELDIAARDTLTRKAKDVQMKKRPLDDFMDPRLKGEVNLRDFVSILGIAVLCVASSSRGRPTIKEVFDEMDRAWKNTIANMHSTVETGSYKSSMTQLAYPEVIEV
ncbi:leucine-rich repeat receptor protein kinase HPCA1 [Elaeis guineensis]|uniref:Cysteine-rich receptor-like protein kinase 1 n=1 Tax=Elaeis guineensis var. tenera TaxID=51953 RepID=A0A6J0PCJ4_ELAGV|nr:cysteine-rich receptor-like protein kinase 1 [Elaeis guineensis]